MLAPTPNHAEEHDNGKSNVNTKTKEDWTLSLPLVVSPAAPSSVSSVVEVPRGSKQHSDAPSGSQPVV